jgi:hypothetical protein
MQHSRVLRARARDRACARPIRAAVVVGGKRPRAEVRTDYDTFLALADKVSELAVTDDPHDIVAELRVGLGTATSSQLAIGKPTQMSPNPCSRPG